MKSITLTAPAKINLYLDILSRREDGYHEIVSLMQSVSLTDRIILALTDREGVICVKCSEPSVPSGDGNIAYRAAEKYLEAVGENVGVDIYIFKKIPAAAGLGGGSSDAAAVLRGLDILLGERLGEQKLCEIGAAIGADVPFCISGGAAEVGGIGERLKHIPQMPDCHMVIATPELAVSTPEAYRELDSLYGNFAEVREPSPDFFAAEKAMREGNVDLLCASMFNIFEQTLTDCVPVRKIKALMEEWGAKKCMLSGSGPSVFGIFASENEALEAQNALTAAEIRAFYARPCNGTQI